MRSTAARARLRAAGPTARRICHVQQYRWAKDAMLLPLDCIVRGPPSTAPRPSGSAKRAAFGSTSGE